MAGKNCNFCIFPVHLTVCSPLFLPPQAFSGFLVHPTRAFDFGTRIIFMMIPNYNGKIVLQITFFFSPPTSSPFLTRCNHIRIPYSHLLAGGTQLLERTSVSIVVRNRSCILVWLSPVFTGAQHWLLGSSMLLWTESHLAFPVNLALPQEFPVATTKIRVSQVKVGCDTVGLGLLLQCCSSCYISCACGMSSKRFHKSNAQPISVFVWFFFCLDIPDRAAKHARVGKNVGFQECCLVCPLSHS